MLEGFWLLRETFLRMPTTFHIAITAMFAALVGSFINVCIWRIPRGQSIVWPRSRCTSCGHVLDAIDLLPIVTFVATRGHCRHCKAPVSSRYVIVELINVSLWMVAFAVFGMSIWLPVAGATLSTILAITGITRMKGEIRREAARAATPDGGRGGFTFISVMLACFMLAVSVGPFLEVIRQVFKGSVKTGEYVQGWTLAQEKIEELHTLPFAKIVSDRKIFIETERASDNIFADEFFGEYSMMREDPKYFNDHFTDVYSDKNALPTTVMDRFKRAYKAHYGTDYEPYPAGYEAYRRTLTVQDSTDKADPKLAIKKATVTVEIHSAATKSKIITLEAVFTNR
jgi:hypothetical protein